MKFVSLLIPAVFSRNPKIQKVSVSYSLLKYYLNAIKLLIYCKESA
ncbi:hypothetical protein KAOT1_06032 [Kordia algicida OT-1]|uniref:Uncharacterized protein n=1 Tax=Kordia algicida OT-1 TaxID=391587 RepID=A9EBH4_9FLAO|nr:hypothetical protein KAOT1_06032 [Kordia algicida OT-1]